MSKKPKTEEPTQFVIGSLGTYTLCAAMTAGLARWEPFPMGDGREGEVCVGGLRYATKLNKFGVPEMHAHLYERIKESLRANGWEGD